MSKQLTREQRHTIEKMLEMKIPVVQIAKQLGFHRSTLYREIQRGKCELLDHNWNSIEKYQYDVGQRVHDDLAHHKGCKKKLQPGDPFLQEISGWILQQKYSPEAALYRAKEKKLCVRSLYNYIYSGNVPGVTVHSLPYAKPKKKKRGTALKRPSRGRSIELRPDHIQNRQEYGHWEMDTVYSSKDDLTCLLVLSERKTREELLFKIKNRTAAAVIHALDRYEKRIGTPAFREKFKTITCDNGVEFSDWQSIERSCRTKGHRTITYFCHPYCSSERGTNENINRMIRRWIPKGDDIGLYSDKEIHQIQDWINSYPRGIHAGLSAQKFIEENELCKVI